MHYLRPFALSAILTFSVLWLWIAAMPMAYMDSEYASWRAKQLMVDRCDLGELIVVGDSRAAADIIPARLPVRATNLAVGGAAAIEVLSVLNQALACPTPPRLVIISLDPGHFFRPDGFWHRGVHFGFMTGQDIAELRDTSRATGDASVYASDPIEGLPLLLRDWLYRIKFPPLYAANLAHAGLFMRWPHNQSVLATTLSARGHFYFGTDPGSSTVTLDGHIGVFVPRPVLDHYFNKLLALLDRSGIEARFIAMPVNDATWNEVNPAVRDAFAAYLAGYEHRYPHFRVASDIMPHWPDRFFGDKFCHLNPAGAERFSDQLAQRLQDAPPSTQNDAQNGWLRGTGTAASAKVVPISKRGS